MKKPIFCIPPGSNATLFAKIHLSGWGYEVTGTAEDPVTHLLLPIPTPTEQIPKKLPTGQTLIGGKLGSLPYPYIDLLQDEYYLQENAAITAECAVKIAQAKLSVPHCHSLVIGWGRIGKCLISQLQLSGAKITVAARKAEIRKHLQELGLEVIDPTQIHPQQYDLIYNTAPAPVLDASGCNAICIDLASLKGIEGPNVIWARGLPGKMAPEASGALIAKTALRYALGKE